MKNKTTPENNNKMLYVFMSLCLYDDLFHAEN